jgi:epoxyqueuosine reductase
MTDPSGDKLSELIKEKAFYSGFDLCGIARARVLVEREQILNDWCETGMNAGMRYLCRSIENRINPGYLVPNAKSVIVTGLNYFTSQKQGGDGIPVISRYAYGKNYHDVITEKLETLLDFIKVIVPGSNGRSFVDSSPILEKAWAMEAGLGWQGRHSILINTDFGSYIFLGIIVLDVSLDYDNPFTGDPCGSCRLCIEGCPTGAINEDRTINASKCISYQTIENKGPVPDNFAPLMGDRVFGCDRCQEVCPWNKKAKQHKTSEFNMKEEVRLMTADDWKNLTREKFNSLFIGTPIERRKYDRFMRNVTFVTNHNVIK